MKIRQEIHYIQKFGLNNHLEHIGENRTNYLCHLKGKIEYALFVNPKDGVSMIDFLCSQEWLILIMKKMVQKQYRP